MHNLLKRQYSNKQGRSCALCKPHKHHHADHRTKRDICADIDTFQQMADLEEDQERSRSLVTAALS